MLNISVKSNLLELKVKKNIDEKPWTLNFSNAYTNISDNNIYSKIYYSGNNRAYSSGGFSCLVNSSAILGHSLGPFYLTHGWNDVDVYVAISEPDYGDV